MKLKGKKLLGKSTLPIGSIAMYTAATIIILIAVVVLINTVISFQQTVAQYVAQGYPYAQVAKQLTTSQLLPGIAEAFALYGGIAFILFSAGAINRKVSKCLNILEFGSPDVEEAVIDTDTSESAEIVEGISEVDDKGQSPQEN